MADHVLAWQTWKDASAAMKNICESIVSSQFGNAEEVSTRWKLEPAVPLTPDSPSVPAGPWVPSALDIEYNEKGTIRSMAPSKIAERTGGIPLEDVSSISFDATGITGRVGAIDSTFAAASETCSILLVLICS